MPDQTAQKDMPVCACVVRMQQRQVFRITTLFAIVRYCCLHWMANVTKPIYFSRLLQTDRDTDRQADRQADTQAGGHLSLETVVSSYYVSGLS